LKSTGDGSRQFINGAYPARRKRAVGLPYHVGDKASFESDILESALEVGKLYGYSSGGKFIDIGAGVTPVPLAC
jgi:NDP-sugar pyrophosphorylase family protein